MIGDFLYRITEPVLRPIRNIMPNLGGIDISPVILILLIILIQNVISPLHLSQRVLTADGAAVPWTVAADGIVADGAADAQGRPRRDRRQSSRWRTGAAC